MSDATKNLRNWRGSVSGDVCVSVGDLRWLADDTQDVIDALAARVEKLEDRQGVDRTRTDARGSVTPEASKATGSRKSGPDPEGSQPSPAAPAVVPAPRKFRVGDKVRHCDYPAEEWTVDAEDKFCVSCIAPKRDSGRYMASPHYLTLVRAADAPEAPAEDAGLVERMAKVGNESAVPCTTWTDSFGPPKSVEISRVGTRAILAALRAEGRLCEPGDVARLTAERDTWKSEAEQRLKTLKFEGARAEKAEKDLAALKAKPRFRTRKVTFEDSKQLREIGGYATTHHFVQRDLDALRALGFRRRVDGAK